MCHSLHTKQLFGKDTHGQSNPDIGQRTASIYQLHRKSQVKKKKLWDRSITSTVPIDII